LSITPQPVQAIQFHEIEFKPHDEIDAFLSKEELNELAVDFGAVSLERKDLSVLKVSFLPHKNGPHAIKAVYRWSQSFQQLIGADFSELFNRGQADWSSVQSSAIAPCFWNLFPENSFKQIIKFTFDAYFNQGAAEQLEIMELQTLTGGRKCWVKWKMTNYPRIELPESIIIAIRPLSVVYQ
jgi:hypothetical protein